DTLERVRTEEPVRPSRLQGHIGHDMEIICLKCLEKHPATRYATALDLADDLRPFLDGLPVRARPVPVWQRLWKYARRSPALVAKVTGAVATVCLAATCLWYLA